jgi:thioester reductase-like protein
MCQDPGAAIGLGYSESKWIAEQLVHAALVAAPALRATCIRTDTLSGSASGAWDRSHWAPSIINAASVLGCVPDLPGVRDILLLSPQR